MPFPIAAAIAGGVGLVTNLINRRSQKKTARRNRQFARDQYNKQRADALTDWNAANKYNAPEEQMNRLRQGGLNPNLVYGKGAQNTADAVRSSSAQVPSEIAPKFDLQSATGPLTSYFDVRRTQAETDNLNEQNAVIKQEALLKAALTGKALAEGTLTKEQSVQLRELRDTIIERAKQDLKKAAADTQMSLSENQRRELLNTQNVKKVLVTILHEKLKMAKTGVETNKLRAMINNVKNNNRLQELDLK